MLSHNGLLLHILAGLKAMTSSTELAPIEVSRCSAAMFLSFMAA